MMRAAAIDPAERKLSAELPASARAETMSLNLGNANLTVPVAGAGAFRALKDLLLSHARIEPGGADERNLGRLLSASCCPRLQRLRLEHITGLAALRLHATAALEELRLDHVHGLTTLELDAPGLRTLHVAGCSRMVDRDATARISGPGARGAGTPGLSIEGHQDTKEMISCVPLLHNITNLTIHVDAGRWHELKATIARLVAKCSGVQRLSIDFDCATFFFLLILFANDTCSKAGCLCNLKDDPTISLEHLREAKITGFPSSMYHKSLLQLMITGAPALEEMTVELIKDSLSKG
ncbi:hypothetical protein C2845_PM06G30040 [Panicum miliaceum]|uniref:At1g61320/AtMIF1 LRR domain-containing protein n=1 Tax=Panicum miliaceum TaxID=4540 RepID=A0A3L6RGI4_PANMI|nr:hypothetical protein C2845_PM06G30040 [Panicum miliaceum]